MDNFCDSAGFVVARIGEFVHLGRVHPHLASHSNRGASDQLDIRAQASRVDPDSPRRTAVSDCGHKHKNRIPWRQS